jgi:predicted permease
MGCALVVTLIVIAVRRDLAYSLVVVWALVGIALKQNGDPTVALIAEEASVVILVALGLSILAWKLSHKTITPKAGNEELSITQTKHS